MVFIIVEMEMGMEMKDFVGLKVDIEKMDMELVWGKMYNNKMCHNNKIFNSNMNGNHNIHKTNKHKGKITTTTPTVLLPHFSVIIQKII